MKAPKILEIKYEEQLFKDLSYRSWDELDFESGSLFEYEEYLNNSLMEFKREVLHNALNQRETTGKVEYLSRVLKKFKRIKTLRRIASDKELITIFKNDTNIKEIKAFYWALITQYKIEEINGASIKIIPRKNKEESKDKNEPELKPGEFEIPQIDEITFPGRRFEELIYLIAGYTDLIYKTKKTPIDGVFIGIGGKVAKFHFFLKDHFQMSVYKRALAFIKRNLSPYLRKTKTKQDLPPSFKIKKENLQTVEIILNELHKQMLYFINDDKNSINDLIEVLTAKDLNQVNKSIYFLCQNTQLHYILKRLDQYFEGPLITTINNSGKFYSRRGTLFRGSNISRGGNTTKDPKDKIIIDKVFKEAIA